MSRTYKPDTSKPWNQSLEREEKNPLEVVLDKVRWSKRKFAANLDALDDSTGEKERVCAGAASLAAPQIFRVLRLYSAGDQARFEEYQRKAGHFVGKSLVRKENRFLLGMQEMIAGKLYEAIVSKLPLPIAIDPVLALRAYKLAGHCGVNVLDANEVFADYVHPQLMQEVNGIYRGLTSIFTDIGGALGQKKAA